MKTAKEYLKEKGLKNPPLDSGISGGGDAKRRYVSDLMQEWSDLNGKFRDKKIKVIESLFSKYDLLDKFQAYQSEATFTSGNKSTHQMVAMSDIELIIDELFSRLTK